ncbi:hypothetical protein GSI_15441 [Ganoderma sinense ZZ0214-1]|uniref:Uncharacterized protein n=1 Tax=Ganoderma sinense ZZ0214-1 TaxID=1077348 RepID=A0A2G8RN56_9APHY|nr:hypothetical protein GSI_15441 [Ganoderma sinense ZZ0214-1]
MSSTRPKPRPRPRARAPATAADVPPSSSPGPSSTAPSTQPALSVRDEDELFFRNRSRSAQAWKELSKATEEKKVVKKRKSGSSDYSGSEGGSSPKARARKKKHPQRKNDTLPDWTKKLPNEIIISSDSDDDIVLTRIKKRPAANGDEDSSPVPETRSRSLTPPPVLDQLTKLRARQAVQRLVGIQPRAPSPTEGMDDSMDTIVLDPELASIARRIHKEAEMRGGTPGDDQGGPEQVQIKVLWKPHPLNPEGREETWGIVQKRHDNFHGLFEEVADLACVRVEHLIICYDSKRVFPSSSPHSVKIWATATFEAYDKITYQYLQENKRARSMSLPPGPSDPNQHSRARSPSVTIMESEFESRGSTPPSQDQGDDSQTFKLIVRSERTEKDITLTVRPTTKCGAIVRAFLKKAGLDAEYPEGGAPPKGRGRGKAAAAKVPALSVDGDRMGVETEIGEAELEDGDQVDVVGL